VKKSLVIEFVVVIGLTKDYIYNGYIWHYAHTFNLLGECELCEYLYVYKNFVACIGTQEKLCCVEDTGMLHVV